MIFKSMKQLDKDFRDGLVEGLIGILGWGLIGVLGWGLIGGLVENIGIFPLLQNNLLLFAIAIIVIVEILFLLDKEKPSKKVNKLWFTINKKFEALIETILLISVVNLGLIVNECVKKYSQEIIGITINLIGIVGILVVVCVIVYGYIKLNSLKYRGA